MARLILFLTAFVLAMPAIADDENKGRAGVMKALSADCEREANQQNLIGKERKMFVKDCTKEGKHVKRRRDERRDRDRHEDGRPAAARPAQPAQPPAAPPPATTAPAQPAPPPSQPASTTTQTTGTVMTAEQKRAMCADEATRAAVPIPQRMRFMETCMAR